MDDWRTTPEERLELIDGHFRELPLFTVLHQGLNSELWRLLHDLRLGNGWVVPQAGFEVSVERRIALIPDIVVTNCRLPRDYPTPEMTDLVIEIWSPEDTAEDRDHRQRIYASVGIRYFWAIEQDGPLITAYELRDGEYQEQITLNPGATGTIMAAPAPVILDPAQLIPWARA